MRLSVYKTFLLSVVAIWLVCTLFFSNLHYSPQLYPFFRLRGRAFKIFARNRTVPEFARAEQKQWRSPFYFVQLADTQFGCVSKFENNGSLFRGSFDVEQNTSMRFIETINSMTPRPKFVVITGGLTDEFPKHEGTKRKQIAAFKTTFAENLSPDIPLLLMPGNHDVGNSPKSDDIENFKADFGDDYYAFDYGGVRFIVLNSQLFWGSYSAVASEAKKQEVWLRSVLKREREVFYKHIVVFQHVPFFVKDINEAEAKTPQVSNFNIDQVNRKKYLDLLDRGGVSYVFSGHVHANSIATYKGIEHVSSGSLSCQFNSKDGPGYRIVEVFDDVIKHKYFALGKKPYLNSIQ